MLRSDSDLEAFLVDYFGNVARRMSSGMDRVAKVNLLLTVVDPDEVLASLRGHDPDAVDAAGEGPERPLPAATGTRTLRPERITPVPDPVVEDPRPPLVSPQDPIDGTSRVVVIHEPEDAGFLLELARHLALLRRYGRLTLWTQQDVPAGTDAEAATRAAIDAADMILVLSSPDLMASDRAMSLVERAMARQRRAECQVVPILVRPVDWQSSPLGLLQPLPRSQKYVSLGGDRDAAWAEVAQGIEVALQYRAKRVQAPEPSPAIQEARADLPVRSIFVWTGLPEYTYVQPHNFDKLLDDLETLGPGLAVEGPSGIGKSVAVRKALATLNVPNAEYTWIEGGDRGQHVRLESVLRAGVRGYVIVDDAHRVVLDVELRKRVAEAILVTANCKPAAGKIVLIGLNRVRAAVVEEFPLELERRLRYLPMDRQPTEKLAELVALGEDKVNVEFAQRRELIETARGSFALLQRLLYEIAMRAGIRRTHQGKRRVLTEGPADVRPDLLNELRDSCDTPVRAIIRADTVSPPRGAGLALLWLLGRADDNSVRLRQAIDAYPALAPAFTLLGARLQEVIRRDGTLGKLVHFDGYDILRVQDPIFSFYLRYLDWADLLMMTDGALRFDTERRLVFAPPPQAGATAAQPPVPPCPPADAAARQATAPPPVDAARQDSPNKNGLGFPTHLVKTLRTGQLIPFAGAGVSMAVRDRQGRPVFPGWTGLLRRAAQEIEQQGNEKKGYAQAIQGLLAINQGAGLLDAARLARDALGPLWFDFLRGVFKPPRGLVDESSLALPRALWELGSRLIVTTNYDRVLRWACPMTLADDLNRWDTSAPVDFVDLLRNGLETPTVWHLHGSVERIEDIIFTPDGYRRLYTAYGAEPGEHYRAALTTLRALLASRTFLFVGFSFADDSFGKELDWVHDVFQGAAGPHYVLVSEAALALTRERVKGLPLDLVPYEENDAPLLELLRRLTGLRSPEG